MKNRVNVDVAGHVARVTLNRPAKHNAADRAMLEAVVDAGRSLAANRAVRAVVLCGAGESFCAGIDVSAFRGGDSPFGPADLAPLEGSDANLFQSAALVWRELPAPVIAAVHGAAFGAGLQIALGADLRLATPDSRWSIMEVRWGLVPDMAISVTARGLIAPDRLKRLAFTGAVIDGTEAERLGLVTEIRARPVEAAAALATELASLSPDALRSLKALLNEPGSAGRESLLRREARSQAALLGSPNQLEAAAARQQGRDPHFTDGDP